MGRSWSQGGAYHVDFVEPLVVKAGADREIYDNVKEETKIVSCLRRQAASLSVS